MYSTDKPTVKYRKDYQPSQYLIKKTQLDFQLFEDHVIVKSMLDIETNPLTENNKLLPLILDGVELELLDIQINNVQLVKNDFEIKKEFLVVNKVCQKFSLSTTVKIFPNKNTSLEGLYMSNGKFCTQCEAEGFRKITYYIDRPEIMSEFFVSIEADKNNYPLLLSNGNPVKSNDDDSNVGNSNRHRTSWHDPFPKPSYLFALVAGDLDCLEDSFTTMSGRKVKLELFVDKGKLEQCRFAMDSLIKSMSWDEEKFGREYDLDLYMIVAVSDFNMGAMENKGLNVFNTAYVLAHPKSATDTDFEGVERVIAHEYFHNWTGNRITCRDWFQLSLKEGLTVYRDQKFSEDMQSASVERIDQVKIIRAAQFAEDSGPMAHSIRPDSYIEMNNFYTVTVYNKGAEVIRMMHTLLGDEGFRAGMDLYFDRHDGQAVTCEDFIKSMEDANQVDWSLFRNWYRQAGTPTLQVELLSNSNTSLDSKQNRKLSLRFTQSCPPSPGQENKEPFMIPVKIGFISKTGKTIHFRISDNDEWLSESLFVISKPEQLIEFEIDDEFSNCIPSLLRGFSSPVKLKYDYSEQQLAVLFAHDSDPFNRWDAGQVLMCQLLESKTSFIEKDQLMVISDSIKNILTDKYLDYSLKTLAVQLPNLNSIIGGLQTINLDQLFDKYRQLKQHIARKLEPQWLEIYQLMSQQLESNQTSGQRRLKNIALSYLVLANENKYTELAISQQSSAKNMTDEISALQTIANTNAPSRQQQINDFYQKWQEEELVLDKWFSVQVMQDEEKIISRVTNLLEHEKFSMTNPNKVRSVIGAFTSSNTMQFHNATGTGYELLASMIVKLNEINPQIGARLAKQFGQWKKFDVKRQAIIKENLEQILELDNLSNDIFEVVSKSL